MHQRIRHESAVAQESGLSRKIYRSRGVGTPCVAVAIDECSQLPEATTTCSLPNECVDNRFSPNPELEVKGPVLSSPDSSSSLIRAHHCKGGPQLTPRLPRPPLQLPHYPQISAGGSPCIGVTLGTEFRPQEMQVTLDTASVVQRRRPRRGPFAVLRVAEHVAACAARAVSSMVVRNGQSMQADAGDAPQDPGRVNAAPDCVHRTSKGS
eukprot:jgi/Ulvmu1/7592/UM038_0015.1